MPDLVVIEAAVTDLRRGFDNIQRTLDLADTKDVTPHRGNVGAGELIKALSEFNKQVSSTKNKYRIKTKNLSDFLKEVSTGSDELDQQIKGWIKD